MTTIEEIKLISNDLQITYKGSAPSPPETKGSCVCDQPSGCSTNGGCTCAPTLCKKTTRDDCLKDGGTGWCAWSIPIPPKDKDGCYGKAKYTLNTSLTGLWYAPYGASCLSNIPTDSGTTITNYNFGIAFLYGASPVTMLTNVPPDSLTGTNSALAVFPSNPTIRALNFGGGVSPYWSSSDKDIVLNDYLPYLQIGGYNGVSFDIEYIDSTVTSKMWNEIFSQFKKCGFHVSITCGSRGVFSGTADWSGIDINNIDVIMPQFYDADGILFTDDYVIKCSNAWLDTTQTMPNRASWISDPDNKGTFTWQLTVLPPKGITADKLARGVAYTQYGGNNVDILNYNVGPFKAGNVTWCVKKV